MFEHDQRFYRNENDELMVTVKVYDYDNNVHGETEIFKYVEEEVKGYFESLQTKYENIEINWKRVIKEKEYFLTKELDSSLAK